MKALLAAVLLAGSLLGTSAHAAAVTADCGFDTIAQQDLTGGTDTFTGAAYGYAVSDQPGAAISVSCEVRVNGGTAASTPPGPSGQASVTVGQVTYVATEADTVTLCAVWTGTESGEACGPTVTQQIPPQETIDLVDSVVQVLSDASTAINFLLCPILVSLSPGLPGFVDIDAEGDVSVAGISVWDCPPYGVFTDSPAADSVVCVEWWQPASHPWIHGAPCHEPPSRSGVATEQHA
jgi:hypothetical protein